MNRMTMITLACLAVLAVCDQAKAERRPNRNALRHAQTLPWHGNYTHTAYGYAVPLVVPPTVEMQTKMGWGVSQSEMVPIYHQFRRPYFGNAETSGTIFQPTPSQPSHTDQFGVYYIRGPW